MALIHPPYQEECHTRRPNILAKYIALQITIGQEFHSKDNIFLAIELNERMDTKRVHGLYMGNSIDS